MFIKDQKFHSSETLEIDHKDLNLSGYRTDEVFTCRCFPEMTAGGKL